jgi:hypothetical protein
LSRGGCTQPGREIRTLYSFIFNIRHAAVYTVYLGGKVSIPRELRRQSLSAIEAGVSWVASWIIETNPPASTRIPTEIITHRAVRTAIP